MLDRCKELLTKVDKTKLIVILGAVGVLLIFLSSLGGNGKSKKESSQSTGAPSAPVSQEAYVSQTQKNLTDILQKVQGVGRVEVMVTLERSSESQYLYEEKQSVDAMAGQGGKSRESTERSYLLVEDQNGKKQAVVQSTLEPVIKGVLIVCDGGGDPTVEGRVLEAVTTLLDVPSNRVYIAKKGG